MNSIEGLSPCKFFEFQSDYVRQRIAFARKMNLRVSEVSITEELLYQFHQAYAHLDMPIRLFESKEEHVNGSDFEVLIRTVEGFLLLACQAKITYKTGNYKSFHHEVAGKRQIDLLRDYAKRNGGIAQYLFYNYVPEMEVSLEPDEDEPLSSGITYLSADEIVQWMAEYETEGKKPPIPNFHTFHPKPAKPFHELICNILQNGQSHLTNFPGEVMKSLTYYGDEDVKNAMSWQLVTKPAQIGYIRSDEIYRQVSGFLEPTSNQEEAKPRVFRPKFRIVIGGTVERGAIYALS